MGQCQAPTQLIIHRDEDLMYYIYVRKLDGNKYIGFAVSITDYYFTRIKSLISLFENEIELLAKAGVIINFSYNGGITSRLKSFKEEEAEVMAAINSLQIKINDLTDLMELPPVDFSVAVSSRKLFKYTDKDSEIAGATCRFGFTIVLKDCDYDTIRTTNYRNILKNLNEEKNALIKENERLKEKNRKINRQKKQFKNVVLLFLIVIGCSIGLFF